MEKPSVTNILKWLQCFTVYVAVQGQKQPERIQDFMGYQALIIDAYLEYKGNWRMSYDQRLQQIAASEPGRSWASVDPTLWNLAFAGQAKTTWCIQCFSMSHQLNNCEFSSISYHWDKEYDTSWSVSSRTRMYLPCVHTQTANSSIYATYASTIP